MLQSCAAQPHSLNNFFFIRSHHTKSLSSLDTTLKLNPWFITGFTDGSVYEIAQKNKNITQTFIRQYSKNALQPMYQNQSSSLVVWGTNLQLTVKERFSRKELAMVRLTSYTKDVVVGLILSDGWLIVNNSSINARLGFSQSVANSKYFWFVFSSLAHYCFSWPIVRNRERLNKQNIELQFFTRSMPYLTEIYVLFYPNKVKVIPLDIYNLLTLVALAHLIMGDGSAKQQYSFKICTDSYSVKDVVRLMNILIIRYELDCTLRFHTPTQPRIHIKQRSMLKLRAIVRPYFCESMMYKLGVMGGK